MGRNVGSRNLGYFYRSGRGWYTKLDGRFIALRDKDSNHLRNKSTPVAELKAAHRRIIVAPVETVNSVTVLEVCDAYLAKVKDDGADGTYKARGDTLFDFCHGLPPRFKNKKTQPCDYIHGGYGNLAAVSLLPLHIDQWLRSHKAWKGGKRTRVQAVLRAMNYGVECGLLAANPLKGFRMPKATARVTYLTPEQEKALCDTANSALSLAIRVMIRTGARPGCEFAALTAKHVKDYGDKMEWVFQPSESKTRKMRTIRITDPDIIAFVRRQLKRKGSIFRNTRGDPWTRRNLTEKFRCLKYRLVKRGVEFDADCCLYSCRHTYAKRTLQGYWSGKATNIETLARLMGNSPKVCADHYLQWTDSYEQPLWESA